MLQTQFKIVFVILFSLVAFPAIRLHASEADFVELFEAIKAGQVDVEFIPSSEKRANLLIANKTDSVLHVQLPDAFAAVPVLAQFNQQLGGQQLGGQQGGGNSQAVGGGAGQGQNFGNGFGLGGGQDAGFGRNNGGFMRVKPQKTRKLAATTVCLEYGKPNPNPRIAYKIVPIDRVTDDERLIEVCRQVGSGELNQLVGQAAAWHLANKMAWSELAKVNRIESRYVGNIKFFHTSTLKRAKKLIESFKNNVKEKPISRDSYAYRD